MLYRVLANEAGECSGCLRDSDFELRNDYGEWVKVWQATLTKAVMEIPGACFRSRERLVNYFDCRDTYAHNILALTEGHTTGIATNWKAQFVAIWDKVEVFGTFLLRHSYHAESGTAEETAGAARLVEPIEVVAVK